MKLVGRLMQGLHLAQNFGTIMKDRGLNVILSNGLADPLSIKLLKL